MFFGREEVAIPVSGSVPEAVKLHPKADVFINFASFRRCASTSTMHAAAPSGDNCSDGVLDILFLQCIRVEHGGHEAADHPSGGSNC